MSVVLVTGIAAVAYAVFTRVPADFLFVFGIATLLGVFVTIGEAGPLDDKGRAHIRAHPFRAALGFLYGVLLFGTMTSPIAFAMFGVSAVVIDTAGWIWRQSVAVVVLGTALAGLAFFLFRLRFRVLYGVTECAVGLAIAFHQGRIHATRGFPADTEFYIAILTAGVYLFVRGLDNAYTGFSGGSDPAAKWVAERAKKRSWVP